MRRYLSKTLAGKAGSSTAVAWLCAAVELTRASGPESQPHGELLSIDAALDRLAEVDSSAAELVKLQFRRIHDRPVGRGSRRLPTHGRPAVELCPARGLRALRGRTRRPMTRGSDPRFVHRDRPYQPDGRES